MTSKRRAPSRVAAAAIIAAAPPAASEALSQTIEISAGPGSCLDQSRRPVDLRRAMFLENRTLDTRVDGDMVRIDLQGQIVRIAPLPADAGDQALPINVGRRVGRDGAIADVELKLALYEGRVMLYWRETFKHRMYRQGLFVIDGRELVAFCEGNGGVQSTQ